VNRGWKGPNSGGGFVNRWGPATRWESCDRREFRNGRVTTVRQSAESIGTRWGYEQSSNRVGYEKRNL